MAYPSFSNPFGFTLTPWVKRLLIANVVLFVIRVALPIVVPFLQFVPADFLAQPWTVVTYMFVHGDFFHLLFNMLGLFFFGPVLEERWGSREFLKFYLICGLGGALLSLIFPYDAIIGASAAIYGIMVAFAMYFPESPIYIWGIFPVKAKWLVTFFVGLSLFYAVTGGQSGVAHLAHLGGAAAAFLYLKSPVAPPAWGQVYRSPAKKKSRGIAGFFSRRTKKTPPPAEPPRRARERELRRSLDDVDRILDKISEGGMASLTEDERRRLEEASRKFRSN